MAHLHDVIDDDLHFIIDPDTRRIRRTSENPIVIVQNDHNSERLTFEIPKVIDGHDMTLCNRVRIHFLNVDAANTTNQYAGMYESTDLEELEDDNETLVFTWLVSKFSTGYAGPLSFAISFECTTEKIEPNGAISTVIEYSWNTLPDIDDVAVSDGMDNSGIIIDDYYDVVDTWLNTIYNMGETAKNEISTYADTVKQDVKMSIDTAGEEAIASIKNFVYEVSEEMTRQALVDTGFVAQTTGNLPDKVMSQGATTTAIESAKTFASSEAAGVRSDLNAQYTDLVADIASLAASFTARKAYNETDYYGNIYLEPGKTYYIVNKSANQSTNLNDDWGFEFKFRGILKASSTSKNVESTVAPDNLVRYCDGYYLNGNAMVIRILEYQAKYSTYTATGVTYPKLEAIMYFDTNDYNPRSISVATYAGTKPGDTWATYSVLANDTEKKYGLSVVPRDQNVIEVYTIDENTSGASFTIDANGISNISKTATSGLTDTYSIVLDDGTIKTFTVKNGDGIKSVTTSDYDDYETTYCITFDSGTTFTYKAPNANSIGIKTAASGSVIHAVDVIPPTHRVDTIVTSANVNVEMVKLTRCGKNMFDSSKLLKVSGWAVTDGVYSGSPHELYTMYSKERDYDALHSIFEPGVPYTLSLECRADITESMPTSILFEFVYTDGTYDQLAVNTSVMTKKTLTSNPAKTLKGLYATYAHKATPYFRNIQLEKGTTATDYEPYSGKTYGVYSFGKPTTTITSVSPIMTIFADKPGVTIDVVYNMDQTASYNRFADRAAADAEAKIAAKLDEFAAALDEFLNGDA